MAAVDSKSAAAYLIDPLNAPEPSAETGPGTHFVRPKDESVASSDTGSTNPFRRSSAKSKDAPVTSGRARAVSQGSAPSSKFPDYREEGFGGHNDGHRRIRSQDQAPPPPYDAPPGRRRGSSLRERYPGDKSHQPLEIIRKDSKKAHRSPHLQRRHIPGADSIDRLDPTYNKIPYHHEGPYDAALLARNSSFESSPLASLNDSNNAALRATNEENVRDAVRKHHPLDGFAAYPPGIPDRLGRTLNYEEDTNLVVDNREAIQRQPGMSGGDSYERHKLRNKDRNKERTVDGHRAIELSDRPLMSDYEAGKKDRKSRGSVEIVADDSSAYANTADNDAAPRRSSSLTAGLKKRIGSLKKK